MLKIIINSTIVLMCENNFFKYKCSFSINEVNLQVIIHNE